MNRRQAGYYERRSGRRAAQEPPIADTFGARGASHETTNLGPDKTAWLGTVAVGSTPVMELALGPEPQDLKMALLRAALSGPTAPTPQHEKIPRQGDADIEVEFDRHLATAYGAVDPDNDPTRSEAFLAKARARFTGIQGAEPHTVAELRILAELTGQQQQLEEGLRGVLPVDEAIQNIPGSHLPPDTVIRLAQEGDGLVEYDPQRPDLPPAELEKAIERIEQETTQQREQGEQ